MEAIGGISAVIQVVSSVTKLAKGLNEFRERYKNVGLNTMLVVSHLTTIEFALQEIAGLRKQALKSGERLRELDDGMDVSLNCCAILVSVLDNKLGEVNSSPSIKEKVRYLWLEDLLKEYVSNLEGQVRNLQMLLSIFQCRTAIEQRQRWEREDAMSVVHKVRDDTVSLTIDDDTGSVLSGPSRIFEFDDIIRQSGPYKSVEIKRRLNALGKSQVISPTPPHREDSQRRRRRYTPPSPEPPPALPDRAPPALLSQAPPSLPPELPNAADNATIVPETEENTFQTEEAATAGEGIAAVEQITEPEGEDKEEDQGEESDGPDFVLPGGLSLGFDVRAKPKTAATSPAMSKLSSPIEQPKRSMSNVSYPGIKRKPVASPSIQLSESDFGRPLSQEAIFSSKEDVRDVSAKAKMSQEAQGGDSSMKDENSAGRALRPDNSEIKLVEESFTTPGAQESIARRPESTNDSLYGCSIDIPVDDETIAQAATQGGLHISPSPVKTHQLAEDLRDSKDDADEHSSDRLVNVEETSSDGYVKADQAAGVSHERGDPFRDDAHPQRIQDTSEDSSEISTSLAEEGEIVPITLDPSSGQPSLTQRLSLDKDLPPIHEEPYNPVQEPTQRPPTVPSTPSQQTVVPFTSPSKTSRQRPPIPTTPSITFTEPVQQSAPSLYEDSINPTLSHRSSRTSLQNDTISSYDSNSTISSAAQDNATLFTSPTVATSLSLAPTLSAQEREREEVQVKLQDLKRQLEEAKSRGDSKKVQASIQDSIALIQRTYLSSKPGHNRSPSGRGASNVLRRLPSSFSMSGKLKEQKLEAIFMAVSEGNSIKLEKLLDDKTNVNMRRNLDYKTPLMCAAIETQIQCMQVLKDRGADPLMVDTSGRTVLHLAVAANKLASVKWLLAKFPAPSPNTAGYERRKSFSISMLTDPSKMSPKSLLETSDKEGSRPLHIAALRGFTDVATALLDASAQLHSKNNWTRTPLFSAVFKGNVPTITLLLNRGASVNDQDINRMAPLHWAAEKNHIPVIRLLLSRGASRTQFDSAGHLPIHRAAKFQHLAAVETFITSQADFSLKTQHGSTLLHVAVAANALELAETLVKNSVEINPWASPRPVRTDDQGNHHALPKDSQSKTGKNSNFTPLHHACFAGLYEMTCLLIDAGAWVNAAPPEDGRSPLMFAVLSTNVNVVTLLLARGAKAGAKTPHSCITAAHLAAQQVDLEMLQHLCANGASMNAKDSDLKTVLDWTMKAPASDRRKECRQWLFAVQAKMIQQAREAAAAANGINPQQQLPGGNPSQASNSGGTAMENGRVILDPQGNIITPSPQHFGDCLHCRNATLPGGVMVPHLEPAPAPPPMAMQGGGAPGQQTVHYVHHHVHNPIPASVNGQGGGPPPSLPPVEGQEAWDARYDAFPDASPPPYEAGPNAPKNLVRREGVWRSIA